MGAAAVMAVVEAAEGTTAAGVGALTLAALTAAARTVMEAAVAAQVPTEAAAAPRDAKVAVTKDAAQVQPRGLPDTPGMPTATPALAIRHLVFTLSDPATSAANQRKAEQPVDPLVKDPLVKAWLIITRPTGPSIPLAAALTPRQQQLLPVLTPASLRLAMRRSSPVLEDGTAHTAHMVGMEVTAGTAVSAGAADSGVPVSAGAAAVGVGVDGAGAVGVGASAGDGVGAGGRSGDGRPIGIARGGTTPPTSLPTITTTVIPITFTRIRNDSAI
jgi:hypothetical protein